MTNLVDIRTRRGESEEETTKLGRKLTPIERSMKKFAQEVEARLNELERRQKRIDSILGRILKKLDKIQRGGD